MSYRKINKTPKLYLHIEFYHIFSSYRKNNSPKIFQNTVYLHIKFGYN